MNHENNYLMVIKEMPLFYNIIIFMFDEAIDFSERKMG